MYELSGIKFDWSGVTPQSNVLLSFSPDDEDRDVQGDRAVDYGKRHQAIDIL